MGMVKLIVPQDEGELALIKSLLDGNGIRYFVHNEHFGSLYPGLPLPFNRRQVMVDEVDLDRAIVLMGRLAGEESSDEAS